LWDEGENMYRRAGTMKVFREKYLPYSRYIKSSTKRRDKYNEVTPVGLTIKEIYELSKEPQFKSFAKCNKSRRKASTFENKDKYEKILLLRNILNNRKDCTVSMRKALNYFKIVDDKFSPLSPLLKWPGGKKHEVRDIYMRSPYLLPDKIKDFYEPFVGGGAFYFSVNVEKMFINDKSDELIDFYTLIKKQDASLFDFLSLLTTHWSFIASVMEENKTSIIESYHNNALLAVCDFIGPIISNFEEVFSEVRGVSSKKYEKITNRVVVSKMEKMKKLEAKKGNLNTTDILKNIEGAYKSAFYTYLRGLYNRNVVKKSYQIALFYFLREYCYSSMFRYNSDGEFNVPYGGLSYNRKNPNDRFDYWKSEEVISHLSKTEIRSMDFEAFLSLFDPDEDDFIFIDPPYDTTFSTYAKNIFGKNEQERLSEYLLTKCRANWMIIIKNTDFIYNLYNKKGIRIVNCDKKYAVSFMNRNDRAVEHLIITNY
jgi:DNA adenine methylase